MISSQDLSYTCKGPFSTLQVLDGRVFFLGGGTIHLTTLSLPYQMEETPPSSGTHKLWDDVLRCLPSSVRSIRCPRTVPSSSLGWNLRWVWQGRWQRSAAVPSAWTLCGLGPRPGATTTSCQVDFHGLLSGPCASTPTP